LRALPAKYVSIVFHVPEGDAGMNVANKEASMRVRFMLLAACAIAVAGPARAQAPAGTITARMGGDWDTLDPQKTRATYGYQMGICAL